MKITSEIKLHINDFEEIPVLAEYLIDKLHRNKLTKSDRDMLQQSVSLIFEIRSNLKI